jgi:hypothetical protein
MGAAQSRKLPNTRSEQINNQIINKLTKIGQTKKGRTAEQNETLYRLTEHKRLKNLATRRIENLQQQQRQLSEAAKPTTLRVQRYTPGPAPAYQLMPGLTGNLRYNLNQYHLRQNKNRLREQLGELNNMTRGLRSRIPVPTPQFVPSEPVRRPMTKRNMLTSLGLLQNRRNQDYRRTIPANTRNYTSRIVTNPFRQAVINPRSIAVPNSHSFSTRLSALNSNLSAAEAAHAAAVRNSKEVARLLRTPLVRPSIAVPAPVSTQQRLLPQQKGIKWRNVHMGGPIRNIIKYNRPTIGIAYDEIGDEINIPIPPLPQIPRKYPVTKTQQEFLALPFIAENPRFDPSENETYRMLSAKKRHMKETGRTQNKEYLNVLARKAPMNLIRRPNHKTRAIKLNGKKNRTVENMIRHDIIQEHYRKLANSQR